jgi:hypothetical protein
MRSMSGVHAVALEMRIVCTPLPSLARVATAHFHAVLEEDGRNAVYGRSGRFGFLPGNFQLRKFDLERLHFEVRSDAVLRNAGREV